MKKQISIAMTTYNGEKFLREQLDSIYSQTLLPDEIIVVDDCSTDNTVNILKEYSNQYGLCYFINKKKLGINKNIERAISLCKNNIIALSDQDDVWLPQKLEICYRMISKFDINTPNLISTGRYDVDENLKIISKNKSIEDMNDYKIALLGHYSQGCTLMFNKALLKYILPFPEDDRILYDIYIGLTAAMIGNIYFISKPLILYRHHKNNICGRIEKNKKIIKDILKIKFKSMHSIRFYGLLNDQRFYTMKEVFKNNGKYFVQERKDYFYRLISIYKNKSFIGKIIKIISIDEIKINNKIFIIIYKLFQIFKNKIYYI